MKVVFSILFGSILLAGCMPKPSDSDLFKNLVVYTDYDTNNDFTQHSTFYLRLDSINYYNSNDPYPEDTLATTSPNSGDIVDYVTRTLTDSLVKRGYQSVSRKQSPDLRVYIYVIENYNVSYSYYPYNYGYGYGYYGYGYGGGGYSASVSDVADIYVQILDLKHPVNGKPKLIWYCDIGDLVTLSSNAAFYKALAQAFKQSPYLRK
jgi:hypothetical protein